MAMIRSYSGHADCKVYIQKYLEKRDGKNRALARDFVNIMPEDYDRWAAKMDDSRERAGLQNTYRYKGEEKSHRTFRHFIISPPPSDNISLEALRELALAWAKEFFGDEWGPGEIGCCEYAIVYHDDNEGHIPHAHVVVNAMDLDTRLRIKFSNKQVHALEDKLQELAKERGLSFFDNSLPPDRAVSRNRARTRAETERLERGQRAWKEDLREVVELAAYGAHSQKEFERNLASLGVSVRVKGDDLVYYESDCPEHSAAGATLGRAFTGRKVLGQIRAQLPGIHPEVVTFEELMADFPEESRITKDQLDKLSFVARINTEYGIRKESDYGYILSQLASERKRLSWDEASVRNIGKKMADVIRARDWCREEKFFSKPIRIDVTAGYGQQPAFFQGGEAELWRKEEKERERLAREQDEYQRREEAERSRGR